MALSSEVLDQWKSWCETNLHRGVRPNVLEAEMLAKGLSNEEARISLGEAYRQTTAPVDHKAIANCAITRTSSSSPVTQK